MGILLKTFIILLTIAEVVFNIRNIKDKATQSNFMEIQQTHLNLNITIDFDKKT